MPRIFFIYWMAQAFWIFVTALPVYLINSVPADTHSKLGALDLLGLTVYGLGLTMEVVAVSARVTSVKVTLAGRAEVRVEQRSKEQR